MLIREKYPYNLFEKGEKTISDRSFKLIIDFVEMVTATIDFRCRHLVLPAKQYFL